MKKILVIIAIIMVALILVSCGEKEPSETQEIIDNTKSAVSATEGNGKTYSDVKKLIASVLDYNNIVDDSQKRIVISYKDDDYSKIEDLTYLMSYLEENKLYEVLTTRADSSSLPTEIEILDDVSDSDLIDENSISDDINYEEMQ